MNGFDLATIALISAEYGLGFCVLAANYRRGLNQSFCLLSLFTGTWMLCLQLAFHHTEAEHVANLIRFCTVMGALFPAGYNLVRLAVLHPEQTLPALAWRNRFWFLASSLIAVLVYSPWYIKRVIIPADSSAVFSIPEPVYGGGFYVWSVYFILSILAVMVLYLRSFAQVSGRQRLDLQIIFGGLCCIIVLGIVFAIAMPLARGDSKSMRLVPFCSVGLQALVAYGIATRQMLDVGAFFRRGIAYGLLCVFLGSLYGAVWLGTETLCVPFTHSHLMLPSLVATIAVALAMGPSRNVLQRFVTRLVGNWHGIDPGRIFPETDATLRSVTTTHVVLRKFGRLCQRVTGTDAIAIYLRRGNEFHAAWRSQPSAPPSLSAEAELIHVLTRQQRPFDADNITHYQPDPLYSAAFHQVTERRGRLALGIYDQAELTGFVLLGEKLSGRIYDEEQQAVLQVMVNRLGIALENASLYTRIQESKLNIEALVDQLPSGVLVIDQYDHITVCNREAARILRLNESPLGKTLDFLPDPLRQVVIDARGSDEPLRDQAASLQPGDGHAVPVRYGCRTFGREGVLSRSTCLIIDDLTQRKRMEEQLRRSDRLSSLGTLSASVAHEIKNPLVAIKTFVQLLPERRDDHTFLDHFSELIGSEVNRIDGIVNQLLSFARPKRPQFRKVSLHGVLHNTLRLLNHDLNRANIQTTREFQAVTDSIWADEQKLEQVVLNLVLNAQEAMPSGGALTLRTVSTERDLVFELADEGCGFSPEAREKAFDPFYTTKETGTGLGLSIVYGIIAEHGGSIELRPRPEGGTCVHIRMPLYQETAPA